MKPSIQVLVSELRELQRQRVCNLKSRIMIVNRLTASVATMTGYHGGMEESERTKRFAEAAKLISRVKAGEKASEIEQHCAALILGSGHSIDAFDHVVGQFEKQMIAVARQLPVYAWLQLPEQRGFGEKSLAIIVGEAGDLSAYANPGKLWKRMGCAPFEKNGVMRMPSTWRASKPGLSADEWTELGYCPRRRSDLWNIEEALIKGNQTGPYRARYLQAKATMEAKHPEYGICPKCKGTGKTPKGGNCSNCKATGRVSMHYHNHAHLLCGKLLLKNLWIQWTGGERGGETEMVCAAAST